MASKRTTNKFGDILGDYYKTNRQISKEESEREGYKGPTTSREKAMIIVVILLFLTLIAKSCFFDEVKNLTSAEQQFKDFVDYTVSEKYNGFLDSKLMTYRVYDIYIAKQHEKTKLNYMDEASDKQVMVIQNDRYNARVRGYLLWIIPVKTFSVTAPTVS